MEAGFLNKCYLIPPRNTETGFDPAHVLSHWDGEGKQGTPDLEWTTLTSYPNFRLRHYSTEIATAWEVVEKLEGDGWGHRHMVHSPNAEHPGVSWTFMKPGQGDQSMTTVEMIGEIPLAICLAALKAIAE